MNLDQHLLFHCPVNVSLASNRCQYQSNHIPHSLSVLAGNDMIAYPVFLFDL